METLTTLFVATTLALMAVAAVLALALLCVWEARQIARLTGELLRTSAPDCRATCDR